MVEKVNRIKSRIFLGEDVFRIFKKIIK